MDVKESRAEAALTERGSDGGAKFAPQYDRSKCPDAGASAFKGDSAGSRPCAVIGPDRVVPPARDCPKKAPLEPWLTPDPVYRRLPDYPHKMSDHKDPSRNISPRQTFQENMQRIIMPPGYNAIKLHEDPYTSKNNKLNVPLEVKYCEVPYNINSIGSDQKHIRNPDHSASNVNPLVMRGVPQGWPAGSVNIRPLRPYGAPEVLQYPDYANCTGPRPVLTRNHTHEELQQLYPEPYYHENNVRFKPYPNIKERYPQSRYEYLGNYSNPYHPPHPYTHKYDIPKTMPPHSYTGYPPVPVKYAERVPDSLMEYQRAFSQPGNYTVPIRNPVIHPPYRPMPGNHMQNKLHPYPPDGQHKPPVPNKLPYDPTSKMYLDYDSRTKIPVNDNYYLNELPRSYQAKNTIVLPNYANMHSVNTHPYYIKENVSMKNYEYARLKNIDPAMVNHSLTKLPPQFSPSTLAISPADSNASNETVQTHGTGQEDCGYASQSSVASVRSLESLNRMPMDPYGRYDYRYGPAVRTSPSSKPESSNNQGSKSKKDIRQFISSWSEGDDENSENSAKRDCVKTISDDKTTFSKQYEAVSNQEQLYVLGLVNVPREELSKYEHIQKVSKLPENIKGYNSLELLNQFEEAIESSNIISTKPPTPRAVQIPMNITSHKHNPMPRAVSPLDVEAKISQSVIHKEVGCNFEIKPCSPKMLNVEVATPMQTLLNERVIEKVANPRNMKSPMVLQSVDENMASTLINKSMKYPAPNTAPSCKMINGNHLSESSAIDHLKTNYTLQDLESNSGVCLASLPRLDTDIELNFPEVNQQFINANKADSVITTSLTKDLPTLDVEQSDSNTILKNSIPVTEYDISYQFSPKIENETDFSRLSKYRKLKRNVPDDNGIELAKAQATRVDSVIIKNPDNTRSHEDSSDTSISGGYFRNESQEFAMNLVSQAKNLKAKHQQEIDKMFGTSSSADGNSRYNETGINSRSNIVTCKSGPTSFNVLEETARNNIVHVQGEELMHSKDLSNRYLDKAALEMPMNLSPQAKYSTVGVDEDLRNNSSENLKQKNIISDVKCRPSVESICQNKNSQEEQHNICTVSLDKADDTLVTSNDQNVNTACGNQYHEEQHTKRIISGSCSSTDLLNQCDDNDEICKKGHVVLHIDQFDVSTIKTSCKGQESGFEINETESKSLDKVVDTSMAREIINESYFNNKTDLEANGSNIERTDDINRKDQEKTNENLNIDIRIKDDKVIKLKQKKLRNDVTHRKRSTEKTTGTNVKSKDKKIHNSKISLHSKKGKSVEKSIYGELMFSSHNVVTEEKNCEAENSTEFIEVCSNDFKTVFKLANVNHAKENIDDNATKNVETTKSPGVIKEKTLSSCLPITDKCLEDLPTLEPEAIPQQGLPTEISDEIKKISIEEHASTQKTTDSDASGKNVATIDTTSKDLTFDQCQLREKSFMQIKEKEVDMLTASHPNEKQPDEKQVNLNNVDAKEQNTQKFCDKIEKDLDFIPPSNDNGCRDIQIRTKDNATKVCPRHEVKNDICQKERNKHNTTKYTSKYRAIVSKELFSPRFQNLLLYVGNSDTYSSVEDLQIIPQKTEIVPYQPVIEDPETCATLDTDVINTAQTVKESTNNGINLENLSSDSSECSEVQIHNENLRMEGNKDIPNEKLNVISAKFSNISDDSNNLNSDLNEENSTEINENFAKTGIISEIQETCNETPTQSIDESEMIADVGTLHKPVSNIITKPLCDEMVKHYENEFENNCDHDETHSEFASNLETETCSTNIIVIEETSMTQGQCNDYRFDSSDVNTCEFDKKIQSSKNGCDRPRFALKRSLSDSALDAYGDNVDESSEKKCLMLPKKRRKITDIGNMNESHLLNIIQSSRRNSISTFANENFSFCILIDDDCIVAEENYEQENNYIQLEDDSSNQAFKNYTVEHEKSPSLLFTEDQSENNSDSCITNCDEQKTWVDDVGCEETIETEDIAENIVIGEPVSPKDTDLSDYESDDEEMGILNKDADHTSKVKHIYGDHLCTNDAQLVDALYRTPQMDVNKKLMDRESQITEKSHKYYDSDSLEMLLAEPIDTIPAVDTGSNIACNNSYSSAQGANEDTFIKDGTNGDETTSLEVTSPLVRNISHILTNMTIPNEHIESINNSTNTKNYGEAQDGTVHSCESSLDNVFSYIHKGESSYTSSSSPEVSSTTSEEKNTSILLKISNCKGSRISEVNTFTYDKQEENSCKPTEKVYLNPNYNNGMAAKRPLLTKAAQKYIPPIRESIPDLKVKLALPQQSLMKLQKNKVAKEEPNRNMYSSSTNNLNSKQEIPRKVKPKFEDVLKNIDEVQFQMHKEKNKKPKKYIPKVVIKKSENGSHYASTSSKESFNPDLTGRKWQPWVFIEKNQFIDKMALRNKTRAVFSHRRKSYVLADKFSKYKSISSAKFIISQPKINNFSTGNLKYTIKLKHTY